MDNIKSFTHEKIELLNDKLRDLLAGSDRVAEAGRLGVEKLTGKSPDKGSSLLASVSDMVAGGSAVKDLAGFLSSKRDMLAKLALVLAPAIAGAPSFADQAPQSKAAYYSSATSPHSATGTPLLALIGGGGNDRSAQAFSAWRDEYRKSESSLNAIKDQHRAARQLYFVLDTDMKLNPDGVSDNSLRQLHDADQSAQATEKLYASKHQSHSELTERGRAAFGERVDEVISASSNPSSEIDTSFQNDQAALAQDYAPSPSGRW